MVNDHFLRSEHKAIWKVVDTPEEAVIAIQEKESDNGEWRKIAKI
jgi:predicted Rossmann-fold nucleotide-binding protein